MLCAGIRREVVCGVESARDQLFIYAAASRFLARTLERGLANLDGGAHS